MKKQILLIFFLFTIGQLKAQHTVSGIVVDKSDNTQLIRDVLVYIPEFNRTDLTREGGTYILRNIGIGQVHIQFSKHGYKSVVKTINTIDSATVFNIDMEPSTAEPDEITSVSDFSKYSEDSPFPVDLFSADRLRRTGTIDFVSALAYMPGVDKTSLGNFNKSVIRGLTNAHIVNYQSGMRIENNSWNDIQDDGLTEIGTDHVELIKGPASLMYGGSAMGGVIIYRDEKMPALGTTEGVVNLGLFNNTMGANLDVGIKSSLNNGLFYSVHLAGKSHTSYIQGEGNEVKKNTEVKEYAYNSGQSNGIAKGIIGISKKWGHSKFAITYSDKYYNIVTSYTDSLIATFDEDNERERNASSPYLDQTSFSVSSESIVLLKKSQMHVNLSYQTHDRNDIIKGTSDVDYLNGSMKINSMNYDLKIISDASQKFGYTVGMQINDKINKIESYALFVSENHITESGIYTLARYDLAKINFLAGVRYDKARVKNITVSKNEDYNIFSGSAGVVYHLNDEFTVKLNGSTGSSVPVAEKYLTMYNSYTRVTSGNITLEAEKNYEGDFGITWKNESVTINANAFYNMIDNYVYQDRIITDYVYHVDQYQYFQADANLMGGEFTIDLHPATLRWLDLSASYSTVKGEFRNTNENLPAMPADKIVSELRFQSEKMNYLYRSYVSVVASTFMKQDKLYYYESPSDGYTLFDLHLGGSFKWGQQMFDITVCVNNILDENYFNQLSMIKNAYPVPVYEMGRSVSLSLHVPFGIKQGK